MRERVHFIEGCNEIIVGMLLPIDVESERVRLVEEDICRDWLAYA